MPFLCALVSCGGEKKEIVDVGFDPNNSYTMKATQIVTMVSDSGITRYKVVTAEWLMFDEAEEPYWFFPEKVHLEKFDSLFRVEASVDADTAYYYKRKELWKLSGNVRVKNLEGEQFETELLFWNACKGIKTLRTYQSFHRYSRENEGGLRDVDSRHGEPQCQDRRRGQTTVHRVHSTNGDDPVQCGAHVRARLQRIQEVPLRHL